MYCFDDYLCLSIYMFNFTPLCRNFEFASVLICKFGGNLLSLMISFTHLSTPVEVLSFRSSCNASTSCLVVISYADNVNVKFEGV